MVWASHVYTQHPWRLDRHVAEPVTLVAIAPLTVFHLVQIAYASLPLPLPFLFSPVQMLARKPTWSWLDRLRSSKGLPVTNEVDLEQFLNQNPNSPQIQPKSNPNSTPLQPPNQPIQEEEDEKWFSTMSNVLSELFVMDGSNSNFIKPPLHKKSSRKQKNPKVCIFSEETEVKEGDGDGDEERLDLLGFSRSDVVVIDTSNASNVGWKTEKIVCRKGDLWKVREMERDGWSSVFVRKKRKLKSVDEEEYEEESEEVKKKRKRMKKKKNKNKKKVMMMKKKHVGVFCPRSKVSDRVDNSGISPFESSPENENQVAKKRSHPNLDQTPTKRGKYLRLSGKPAKKSSLLHI